MHNYFEIVDWLLLSVFGIFTFYLAALSALALFSRKRGLHPGPRTHSFIVVVPAHNEEAVLGRTLESLYAVDYPASLREVIVIADNCTDSTKAIAEKYGATVFERFDTAQIGKGYALRWAFDRILASRKKINAIFVLDADSVVTPNILNVLDKYLQDGARAIQIADIVQPNNDSWNTEIIRLGFTLYNVIRPMGKKALGLSAGLRGNGMCFSIGIIKRIPWNAYSLAEDLEYGLTLLLHGETVTFAPEASVLASMPEKSDQSQTQRARWEAGRFPIIKKFAAPLLFRAISKGSLSCLDSFIDLLAPPFVNLCTVLAAMCAVHVALLFFGVAGAATTFLAWVMLSTFAALHVVVGLSSVDADDGLYRAIAHVPRYALWKIQLYVRLASTGERVPWLRTERSAVAVEFNEQITSEEQVRP
jgi:cellulose synthase/poly-beta-1,6-N-acetylglucosamine synthase-like glycosyltransferase